MAQNEVIIVGAGLLGSSVAWHLAEKGCRDVVVIDPDLEGLWSSSELNAGGVRATMNHPLNIQLSIASIEFLDQHREDVGYRPVGYLWLRSKNDATALTIAREATKRQRDLGWPVEEWTVAELCKRVPFLDKTDDLAEAHFASRDGLVNPNRLKQFFREGARAKGVRFLDRRRLRSAEFSAKGWSIVCDVLPASVGSDQLRSLLVDGAIGTPALRETLHGRTIVNCAGAWAGETAAILGYETHTKPQRRQICVFDSRDVDLSPYGMIVDTSGVYFHPEGGQGLAGFANRDEPFGKNFEYNGAQFFEECIWAPLYERSSGFERLKHVTGWAGLYEVTPDHSAVLGAVEHSKAGKNARLFEAHGFSGHGAMQCPAAGRAIAEAVTGGRYETLDVTALSGKRFLTGALVHESFVI